MGGLGSGRVWYDNASETTESYKSMDIRKWHREGLLAPNLGFYCEWRRGGRRADWVRVFVEHDEVVLSRKDSCGEWRDMPDRIQLDWTACHLGGHRPWFLCPVKGCGRRVAILYGGLRFICRHCRQLTYQSQRETDYDRALNRAIELRKQMDWQPGIAHGIGPKPTGMHWTTFGRLVLKHNILVQRALNGIAKEFNF